MNLDARPLRRSPYERNQGYLTNSKSICCSSHAKPGSWKCLLTGGSRSAEGKQILTRIVSRDSGERRRLTWVFG